MRAGHCFFVVLVFVSCAFSYEVSYEDTDGVYYYQPSESVRDKRTLGIFLKSFADAIGYDVQKRPSILPIAAKPVPMTPAAAPVPVPKAPAVAPAPVPKVPVAAPAPVPKAPAPAPKVPVAAPAPVPKVPVAAPAPAPKVPAAAPVPAPKAPAAAPVPAPKIPAAVPAPVPNVPAVAPAPKAVRPPTAPPLLTETIQKMFNINFNWNRNVQPNAIPAAGGKPAAGAPVAAPGGPAAKAPPAAPAIPAPAAPAIPAPAAPPAVPPKAPAPVPIAPITPATKAPPLKYQQEQADYPENVDYNDPQNIIYYPDYQESVNQPQTNQVQDYSEFPRVINAFWQNSPWNRNKPEYNVQNGAPEYQQYVTPDGESGYRVQHYQQNQHLQHQDVPQENSSGENQQEEQQDVDQQQPQEQGQEQPQYQQQSQEQEQEQPQYQQQPQEQEQEQPQYQQQQQQYQQQQQQYQPNQDVNMNSAKDYYQYNQPRGFQPVYLGSESKFQSGYFRPGLPLSVHGIQEDKVLIAWPTPFESAESEIKKKIAARDRIQTAGSEHQEYSYKPDSYDGYSFYEVPEPKSDYYNYKTPADPKIEDELSPNAKVSEDNYGKKYTNIRIDRNTQQH